jgi:hypothetical protein
MTPQLINMAATFTAIVLVGGYQHVFGIGGKPVLCVPESDMDPAVLRFADESTDLHVGSGHTPGFSFLFSSRFMRSVIDGYSSVPGFDALPYVNNLSGTVHFLGQDDRARLGPSMRARNISDEWYSRDKCPQPIVKPLEVRLYEVRCNAGANYSTIWNRAPDPTMMMPNPNEFIIATCNYKNILFGPDRGMSLRDCNRVVIINGFLVDYRLQEENVKFVSEIDALIRNKLSEWERNCSI